MSNLFRTYTAIPHCFQVTSQPNHALRYRALHMKLYYEGTPYRAVVGGTTRL